MREALILTERLHCPLVAVAVSSATPAHVKVLAVPAAVAVHQLSALRRGQFAGVLLQQSRDSWPGGRVRGGSGRMGEGLGEGLSHKKII